MAIAEHHPDKLHAANKGLLKMSHEQLHDFASGPVQPSRIQIALKQTSSGSGSRDDGGMGSRPTLKNSTLYNKIKELKNGSL